jgi:hypothetical protein
MDKLTTFSHAGERHIVSFIETMQVCEGVSCDVYTFPNDQSRDLAIVHVTRGRKTPLQKVLLGEVTIEGFFGGEGTLSIDGGEHTYVFNNESPGEVEVSIGQTMQWKATGDSDLVFYEICQPPYKDGRFEHLTN